MVTDSTTGLQWQRSQAPDQDPRHAGDQGYTLAEAVTFCSDLESSGAGWRVPTREELLGIVDVAMHPAICNQVFDGSPDWFWTSTPDGTGDAVSIAFSDGHEGQWAPTLTCRVRCVR